MKIVSVNIEIFLSPGWASVYFEILQGLWQFLSQVQDSSHFLNTYAQLPRGSRAMRFGFSLHLYPYLVCVSSKGSERMH